MKKGRKTTQEERTEIVAFCIENGKDYGLTMEKYGVSYQQIYLWVRKYEVKGIEGLSDRRGKAKPEDELTEGVHSMSRTLSVRPLILTAFQARLPLQEPQANV